VTEIERLVPREGIEAAFRNLQTTGQLTSVEVEKNYASRSPVYITIMSRQLAQDANVRMRELDRALWQYSDTNQGKRT
jgi:hypothetical protein